MGVPEYDNVQWSVRLLSIPLAVIVEAVTIDVSQGTHCKKLQQPRSWGVSLTDEGDEQRPCERCRQKVLAYRYEIDDDFPILG